MKLIFTPVLLSLLLGPALVVSLVVSVSTGCNSPNAAFCDISASCNAASDLTFCDIDGVYPGSSAPNECIVPPAVDACNRVMPCAGGLLCSDDAMGTCVACQLDSDCSDGKVCDGSGSCTATQDIPCTEGAAGDAQCKANPGSLDYCLVDTCVQCTEDLQCQDLSAPVCNAATHRCRACEKNSECASGLCGVLTGGECDEADTILVVDDTNGNDDGGCGSSASPCKTIGAAIAKVSASKSIILIKEGSYSEKLLVDAKRVTFIGSGVVQVNPALLAVNESVLKVGGLANVTLDGVDLAPTVTASGTQIVLCEGNSATLILRNAKLEGAGGGSANGLVSKIGCNLDVSGSTISGNGGIGISATNGSLSISGSTIDGNDNGGLKIDGASTYSVVNNFITRNGYGLFGSISGVLIRASGATISEQFDFNTVAYNRRPQNNRMAMECDSVNLVAKNNLFMLEEGTDRQVLSGCDTDYSLIDAQDTGSTGTHTSTLSANATFVDTANGDFHLTASSPGIDAADPAATLDIDVDGNPRPVGAGRDMGAHEIQ